MSAQSPGICIKINLSEIHASLPEGTVLNQKSTTHMPNTESIIFVPPLEGYEKVFLVQEFQQVKGVK